VIRLPAAGLRDIMGLQDLGPSNLGVWEKEEVTKGKTISILPTRAISGPHETFQGHELGSVTEVGRGSVEKNGGEENRRQKKTKTEACLYARTEGDSAMGFREPLNRKKKRSKLLKNGRKL